MTLRRALRGVAVVAATAVIAAGCAYEITDLDPALPANEESSVILAADGSTLAVLHGEQNRVNVAYDDIPEVLRDAVVAIEDARFWEHTGVDLRAVVRAALRNARAGGITEGGSTITQQYVKNALLSPERSLTRKIREASLAWQLERNLSKERILELYLNTIYFGNGAYGVEAAARTYFGVGVGDLDLARAATLAGIIRNPSAFDPFDNPDAALARRNLVIDRMEELGWVDAAAARRARGQPLELAAEVAPADRTYPAGHFVEEVKRQILSDPRFGATRAERARLLFGGGLRIHTTLDPAVQEAAEEAVATVVGPDGPEAAVVVIEPSTGFVRAMVGGRDFFGDAPHARFNLATQKGRPAGSAFKPLVLAAAFEAGRTPETTYPAPARLTVRFDDGRPDWEVENYGAAAGGPAVTLREATVRSYNTAYAQLILDVGADAAMDMARRLGIRSPLQTNPAAVLGTNDVTPLDMASAYGTLANRGVRVPPALVTLVTRPDGTVLFRHTHRQQRVVDADVADGVTSVLREVVTRGTGTRAALGDRPVAGKTGTGQQWRDAWFVGYTPQLVSAVWVGFPTEARPMVPPTTPIRVTGGSWPAEIFRLTMSRALAGTEPLPFPDPPPTTTTTTSPPPPPARAAEVTVPAVAGMTEPDARRRLAADALVAAVRMVTSDRPPGTVLDQDPPAGSRVTPGAAVRLTVSAGPPGDAPVPRVVGMTGSQASAELRRSGFDVVIIREPEQPGAGGPAGLVWKQSPPSAVQRPRGTTVTLWVSP